MQLPLVVLTVASATHMQGIIINSVTVYKNMLIKYIVLAIWSSEKECHIHVIGCKAVYSYNPVHAHEVINFSKHFWCVAGVA